VATALSVRAARLVRYYPSPDMVPWEGVDREKMVTERGGGKESGEEAPGRRLFPASRRAHTQVWTFLPTPLIAAQLVLLQPELPDPWVMVNAAPQL